MRMIVNVNPQWGIGYHDELLCRFREDMERFRVQTAGKVLVYGRKTLESFPGKRPLHGRVNVVISSSESNVPRVSKETCDHFTSVNVHMNGNISTRTVFNHDSDSIENTSLVCLNNPFALPKFMSAFNISDDDVFICGGEQIYKKFLPLCNTVYVTKNDFEDAKRIPDTFFPNLDEDPEWIVTCRCEHAVSSTGIGYEFLIYSRK